jgi:hypothetical protein
MTSDARKLLDEALDLPQEARAALAASLIDSLDDEKAGILACNIYSCWEGAYEVQDSTEEV